MLCDGSCCWVRRIVLLCPSHPSAPPRPAQVAVGITLGVSFSTYNTATLPSGIAYVALVFICIFVAGFAWCAAHAAPTLHVRVCRGGLAAAKWSCSNVLTPRAPPPALPRRSWGPLGWLVPSEIQVCARARTRKEGG